MLTLFYDGSCPLCAKEMDLLRMYDENSALCLIDLHSEAFQQYPQINFDEAMSVLHAVDNNGNILKGLDVTAAAWKAVNKKSWIQMLRWPVIRWFADRFYLWFARNRYRLSWLLTGQERCRSGQCSVEDRP